MSRDFTYIDDIVNGVVNVLKKPKSSSDKKVRLIQFLI